MQPHPIAAQTQPSSHFVTPTIQDIPGLAAAISMRNNIQGYLCYSDDHSECRSVDLEKLQIPDDAQVISIKYDYDDESSLAEINSIGGVVLEHIHIPTDGSTLKDDPGILETAQNLAAALSETDTERCYIPTCIGYFKDIEEARYSIVFKEVFKVTDIEYTVTKYSLFGGLWLLKEGSLKNAESERNPSTHATWSQRRQSQSS